MKVCIYSLYESAYQEIIIIKHLKGIEKVVTVK